MSACLVRGAAAGAVGTLALGGFALLRNAALGHAPPYAARRIASRLLGQALHRPMRARLALVGSLGLRFTYGPLLGLVWARLRAALPASSLTRGLALGAGVWAIEHLTFPMLRATSPARTWTCAEHALLLAQTLLFGLTTEQCLTVLEERTAARLLTSPGERRPALPSPSGQ